MNISRKKIAVVLVVVAVAGGFLWWWDAEGQYRNIQFVSGDPDVSSPEKYERYYEALKRAYAKDQYGGATPEETLQLFIDALKAGDVELASKYFVVEKQGEMGAVLQDAKDKNILDGYISDGVKLQPSSKDDEKAFFVITGNSGVVEVRVVLMRNTLTNKWKISEL